MSTLGVRFLSAIVRNDAMKHDPPEIYGWRNFAIACSACLGGMLFGMDVGIIGGVLTLPAFVETYELDQKSDVERADLESNIVATLQGGCFFGSLFASWVADKLGRRMALIISAAVTIVGCIMQAAGEGILDVMFVGRFVAGLGVGAASMITPLYISENAPRAIRGGLTGIYQLFIVTGVMLAFWINYGSLQNFSGTATYVVPLSVQALPAILMLFSMMFCNESPRFLAKKDRWEDAQRTLERVRQLPASHDYIQEELSEIKAQLDHERMLISGSSVWDLQKEMWLIPGNRKRALISVGLMVCQQMTGVNAINYYAPLIFANLGITGTENGLFATGIYGITKMATCLCFLLFAADSLGRRRSLLWTSIAQGVVMYYIGLYVRIDPPIEGEPVPGAGYVALVCVYLFAGFFQFGWGPVCWIYASEIPSARLRSQNVALAAATQWLFNFVVAKATPVMLETVGSHGYGAYLIYGSFCFSMFFFAWFFIPETKGISLEKMDELFGVTEIGSAKDEEAGGVRPAGSSADGADSKDAAVERVEEHKLG
ncbi:general substrate transporter [Lineolata rhizophorae]|uniref:General substrate transporter n=1 Tax=Lineolata rhizophorae TaxID=578093 RepID=A0A6A6NS37_9PEZI|nr:general substrate transporter [Lineolata rhizophorae]